MVPIGHCGAGDSYACGWDGHARLDHLAPSVEIDLWTPLGIESVTPRAHLYVSSLTLLFWDMQGIDSIIVRAGWLQHSTPEGGSVLG